MQVDTPLNPIVKTGNPKHKHTQGKSMKCDTVHSYLTTQRKQYNFIRILNYKDIH